MARNLRAVETQTFIGNYDDFPAANTADGSIAIAEDANYKVYQSINGAWTALNASQIVAWTVSKTSTSSADNGKIYANNTSSNLTLTISQDMPDGFSIGAIEGSTGTCTFAPGSGVTFIGGTYATTTAGDSIAAIWVSANTYVVSVA